ncbi:hypothetical protein PTI98_004138 [Pleurotus ostreatus]|nr:hypothetical protein PTI98_013426 [Pleurotus ostreatus]KAJ8694558.1 hypothetical protein PTI98_007222 [Pleurotus ostreatus]KAJ8694565.1 hypothetical protein PTI98_007229 [Pleurotus ostreatus]KAJ8701181.1 hypothetical protein PTI98_004138 [Pleurotus ostreatus]
MPEPARNLEPGGRSPSPPNTQRTRNNDNDDAGSSPPPEQTPSSIAVDWDEFARLVATAVVMESIPFPTPDDEPEFVINTLYNFLESRNPRPQWTIPSLEVAVSTPHGEPMELHQGPRVFHETVTYIYRYGDTVRITVSTSNPNGGFS